MMFMNEIPTLCISISKNPSSFGYVVHNAGYKKLKLNYFYMPFKIDDLKSVITSMRVLGIRGCGVSMPFKETVIAVTGSGAVSGLGNPFSEPVSISILAVIILLKSYVIWSGKLSAIKV